jgi:hypothetical protein
LGLIEKLSGLPTVAAEADSVQMLQICQDVAIGEGDSQLINSTVRVMVSFLIGHSVFVLNSTVQSSGILDIKAKFKLTPNIETQVPEYFLIIILYVIFVRFELIKMDLLIESHAPNEVNIPIKEYLLKSIGFNVAVSQFMFGLYG